MIKQLLKYGLEAFGIYYSNYRGYVVDTKDPQGMGRLLIHVPAVDGDNVDPTWVPPKGLWGGDDYGLHIIPNRGDVVWVEYLYGKSNKPIWSHHGWKEGEKPEEFTNSSVYGFKTPLGHKVYIDDNTNIITLEHKDGTKFSIDEGKFELKHKDGQVFTMENDKIAQDASGIELGKANLEPALKGDQTYNLINQLILDLSSADVVVGGVPGTFGPTFLSKIPNLNTKLATIKSQKVKLE